MVKYCVKKNHTVVLKLESIVTKCHRFTTIDKWRLMGFEPLTFAPQSYARPLCYNCRQDCQMLFIQYIDLLIQRNFFSASNLVIKVEVVNEVFDRIHNRQNQLKVDDPQKVFRHKKYLLTK